MTCSRAWLKLYCAGFEPRILYFGRGLYLLALMFHVKYLGYTTYGIWQEFGYWWFDWSYAIIFVSFSFPLAAAQSVYPSRSTQYDVPPNVLQIFQYREYAQTLEKRKSPRGFWGWNITCILKSAYFISSWNFFDNNIRTSVSLTCFNFNSNAIRSLANILEEVLDGSNYWNA